MRHHLTKFQTHERMWLAVERGDLGANLVTVCEPHRRISETRSRFRNQRIAYGSLRPTGAHAQHGRMLDVIVTGFHRYERAAATARCRQQVRMIPRGQPPLPGTRREAVVNQVLQREQHGLPSMVANHTQCIHRVVRNAFHNAHALPCRRFPCLEHRDHMVQQSGRIGHQVRLHANHGLGEVSRRLIGQVHALQAIDKAIVGSQRGV